MTTGDRVYDAPSAQPTGSQTAAAGRTPIWIDPTNGSDSRSGTTLGTAKKTLASFYYSVGDAEINADLTVNVTGNTPASDPLRRPRIGPSGSVLFTGSPGATTLYTSAGGFTARTPSVPATNTPWDVTDTALSANWSTAGPGATSLLFKRIRITSGTHVGTVFWAVKDLGSKKARTSQPIQLVITHPFTGSFASITPVASSADPYVVESLPSIGAVDPGGYVDATTGAGLNTFWRVTYEGLAFPQVGAGGLQAIYQCGLTNALLIGCDLGVLRGTWNAHGCLLGDVAFQSGDTVYLAACAALAPNNLAIQTVNAQITSDQGTIFQGCELQSDHKLYWNDGAVFDSPSNGVTLFEGCTMKVIGTLWGSGNAGVGTLLHAPGANLSMGGGTPTITGTGGNVKVGAAAAQTWASLHATPVTNTGSTGATTV